MKKPNHKQNAKENKPRLQGKTSAYELAWLKFLAKSLSNWQKTYQTNDIFNMFVTGLIFYDQQKLKQKLKKTTDPIEKKQLTDQQKFLAGHNLDPAKDYRRLPKKFKPIFTRLVKTGRIRNIFQNKAPQEKTPDHHYKSVFVLDLKLPHQIDSLKADALKLEKIENNYLTFMALRQYLADFKKYLKYSLPKEAFSYANFQAAFNNPTVRQSHRLVISLDLKK